MSQLGLQDWETVLGNLPDIVVRINRNLRVEFVNQQWTRETGVLPEECLGRYLRDVGVSRELCDMLEFAFDKSVTLRDVYEFEFPLFASHGPQHYATRVLPEFQEGGSVESCLVVMRNITARILAEAKFAESEQRFRAFMNHSPAIAWMKDENGRYVYISKGYEKRFGVRLSDWRGKTDLDVWPADIAKTFHDNDLDILRDGCTREVFDPARDSDGSLSYFWGFKFLVRDAAGRRFVGGTGIDFTTQNPKIERLFHSAAIVDSSPEAIVSKSLDGIVRFWNKSAERLFGYTAEEIVNHPGRTLVPDDVLGETHEILARIGQGGTVDHLKTVRLHKDGRRIDVDLTVRPVVGKAGEVIGAAGFIRSASA